MATSRSSAAGVASLRKDAARGVGEPELPFRRVLIANRGEIAVRIIRACHELGIEAIAVYSDADAQALHTRLADVAVRIGPPAPAESYLRIDAIVDAALATGADAVHPGYGFLAERAAFARAVEAAGLVFVGPSPDAIDALGDKLHARRLARSVDVPVVPGTLEPAPVERPDQVAAIVAEAGADRVPVAGQGSGRRRRTRDAPGRDAGGTAGRPRSRLGGGSRLEWTAPDEAVLVEGATRTRVRFVTAGGRRELLVDGWRLDVAVESERRAALREKARRGGAVAAHGGPTEVRAIIPGRVVVGLGGARGRGRRGSAAPRRGGHEDAERAPGTAARNRHQRGRGRGPDDRGRRRAPGARVSDGPKRPVGEGRDEARDRWRATLKAKAAASAPERRERFETSSGIEIRDLYTPADTAGLDEDRDLGRPGEYPFTRGVQPTMYRSRLWTMRQYAGFATAEETNRRFRYLLEQGQTGLSVAFDLPTQMGYDSDAPQAEGEVGRVGVPIDSLDDMATLLDGLPLGEVSTSMTINSTAPILLALYVAAAEAQGVPRERISGTTQNDILKEYIARGTYIYPPRQSMRLVTDVFEFCARELPRWNTISISGYHMREAGATAAQELAFTMADAIAYVEAAVERGLDVDDFAGRLSFFFAAWSELFEEVAKFRAARRLWATIMRERFGASNVRSMMCRFHVQTAGSSLTAQSVDNNVVRTTVQALSAILGGAQSLHTNSRDEALALPTEEAARLALRTQQILAFESGVTETPDPLAGSWYVESLTNELEAAAWSYLEEIEAMGGTLVAIERGFQQREIQESAYRVQQAVEAGDQVVVGVNRFRDEATATPPIQRIDPEGERRQVERVRRVRAERDEAAWRTALDALEATAAGDGNLIPAIIDAVRARATVGEISDRLRVAWGEHRELITV